MQENSKLIANGTKDSLIRFTGETGNWGGLLFPSQTRSEISFSIIEYITQAGGAPQNLFSHDSDNVEIQDVVFKDCHSFYFDQNYPNSSSTGTNQPGVGFTRVNIDDNYISQYVFDFSNSTSWFPEKSEDINITNIRVSEKVLNFSISLDDSSEMRINIINSYNLTNNAPVILKSYGGNVIRNVRAYIGSSDPVKLMS